MGQRLTFVELNELRGRRWTTEDARRVLASWSASGLSASAFGERHALAAQRLGWWKKRLADWGEGDAGSRGPRLVPAIVSAPAPAAITNVAPVAIRLPSGVVLEVVDTALDEPAWIAAVLGALSRPE